MSTEITREQFIKGYSERSMIREKDLLKEHVILPCNCGEGLCKGWAIVGNNFLSIKAHNELYNNYLCVLCGDYTIDKSQCCEDCKKL